MAFVIIITRLFLRNQEQGLLQKRRTKNLYANKVIARMQSGEEKQRQPSKNTSGYVTLTDWELYDASLVISPSGGQVQVTLMEAISDQPDLTTLALTNGIVTLNVGQNAIATGCKMKKPSGTMLRKLTRSGAREHPGNYLRSL